MMEPFFMAGAHADGRASGAENDRACQALDSVRNFNINLCKRDAMFLQKIFRAITAIVLVVSAAGCATGVPFTETVAPSSGNGVVYVYRPNHSFASWGCPEFSIDGGAGLSMQNGGFHRLELPKGQHLLKSRQSWCAVFPVERRFALSEGETVFIRYNVLSDYKPGFHRYDGPDNVYHGYEIVPRELALDQLKLLRANSK